MMENWSVWNSHVEGGVRASVAEWGDDGRKERIREAAMECRCFLISPSVPSKPSAAAATEAPPGTPLEMCDLLAAA